MTAAPALRLSLAGSELARVWTQGDALHLSLSAASVWQGAVAGSPTAPVEGWSQGVALRLAGVKLLQREEPLMGRIAEAHLWRGDQPLRQLPLPGQVEGPLRLSLLMAVGAHLELTASGIEVDFTGGFNVRDSLAC